MKSSIRLNPSRKERDIERYADENRNILGKRLEGIMTHLHRARIQKRRPPTKTALIPLHRLTSSPGEILRKGFLHPQRLGVVRASRKARIPLTEFKAILGSQVRLTRAYAKKLAALTGTSQAFWLNIERSHRSSTAMQALLKASQKSQRQRHGGQLGRLMEEEMASLRRRISDFNHARGEDAAER